MYAHVCVYVWREAEEGGWLEIFFSLLSLSHVPVLLGVLLSFFLSIERR